MNVQSPLRRTWRAAILMLCILHPAARAEIITVEVTASEHDLPLTPVSVLLPAPSTKRHLTTRRDAPLIQGQLENVENERQSRLTFVAPAIKADSTRVFQVQTVAPAAKSQVEVKARGANVEFWIKGSLFTRYDTTTGPNKPSFYPIMAPGRHQIVRHWPVEEVDGETRDHPHHRGLWFTHGAVNGVDFWLERKGTGKTVHVGYDALQSGPVFGAMRARTEWLTPENRKLAEDTREVRVYPLDDAYLMDFRITIKALDVPLVWGDTKEGTLGLRVADSMRTAAAKGAVVGGQILNSRGQTGNAAWGKAAEWCAYYGPVDGSVVGVAIFDDAKNLRYPTRWHVRDYGLFAANPFGLHGFGREFPAGKGDITVAAGQSLSFNYRLVFHRGTPAEAGVNRMWQAWATPPAAKVVALQIEK